MKNRKMRETENNFTSEGFKGKLPFPSFCVLHSAFRVFHLFNVIAITSLLCGCEYCSTGYWQAKSNSDKLNNLRLGMNKEQVIQVMGEPLKNQVYNKPNTWYYYTQIKWSDTIVSRDECTPIFFKGGVLVGWGEQYYKNKVEFRDPKDEDEEGIKAGGDSGSSNLIKAFEQQLEGKLEKKIEGKSEKEIIEYMEKSAEKGLAPPAKEKKKKSVPATPSVKPEEKPSAAPLPVKSVPPPTEEPKKTVPASPAPPVEEKTPSPEPVPSTEDDSMDSRSVKEILEAAEKDSTKDNVPSQKK
ncbi:MAG: hypothetical protein A2017_03040 [Lentisphaerae bacterium GWF2_44_16]|nr:MAG: hypothetical protein A2017_03040 [Lentisphaerae bacterium GWF2_44_16]